MVTEVALPFRVNLTLFKNGYLLSECVATSESDLYCRIEMDTGIGWLDAAGLYQELSDKGVDEATEVFRVCHSYEKWSDLQQEVVKIKVKLQRLTDDASEKLEEPAIEAVIENGGAQERIDVRDEWYSEYSQYSYVINHPPRIYWLGMVLSALWILIYLLIYPSIPLMTTHWQGIGVPGGCQPWTAICEMQRAEGTLSDVRGQYLQRIKAATVEALAADADLSAFIHKAGKVRFGDGCAGCHGVNGSGIVAMPDLAPPLNDKIWQHGGEVRAIKESIQNPDIHSFGLAQRTDELSAKILAVYIYQRLQ